MPGFDKQFIFNDFIQLSKVEINPLILKTIFNILVINKKFKLKVCNTEYIMPGF